MKRFVGALLLALAVSGSAFAATRANPAKHHFHAHVLSHVAKYSYKATKTVVKDAAKPIVYVGKQLV